MAPKDSALISLLKPYSDSVNGTMNVVIARTAVSLEKKQPQGSLGDMMADALLQMARKKFGVAVDAATLNFGGIRLGQLPAGDITIGKVYELMPFDNLVVLQTMSGKTLQELLNHIAGRKGWPVSGLTMQIKGKEAVNVNINGAPIDEMANYTIALPDYVAGGGDDCNMLKNIPQQNRGYLFRDALIEYLKGITQSGQELKANPDKRVSTLE